MTETEESKKTDVKAAPIPFFPGSFCDRNGVLLRRKDEHWVYRQLTTEGQKVLDYIRENLEFTYLESIGFIQTEVEEAESERLNDSNACVLRHKKIARVVAPDEWTPTMWVDALAMFCQFNCGLHSNGLRLHDAHPFNIIFDEQGHPKFVDFGSIKLKKKFFSVRRKWHQQLKITFLLPIFVHKLGFKNLAKSIRTESVDSTYRKFTYSTVFGVLMVVFDLIFLIGKLGAGPLFYFKTIERLLCGRVESNYKTRWSDYQSQVGLWKDDAVTEIIENFDDIQSVLDVAGNKGYYVRKASRVGKEAILSDIDDDSIDEARRTARENNEPLFVAKLDLCYPTPSSGFGLFFESAYERFQSDLVMALAVSHHLSFRNKVRFDSFAAIVDRFSRKYVLAEYVDFSDIHVEKWLKRGKTPTSGYTEDNFVNAFHTLGYETIKEWKDETKGRTLFLFKK